MTRSPDTQGEKVRRERGQKADTRLIVATAAIPLYRSFAKVRQFAFSSRMRQRRGRRTPPPDNISRLATPLFQPSAPSTIFYLPFVPPSAPPAHFRSFALCFSTLTRIEDLFMRIRRRVRGAKRKLKTLHDNNNHRA